LMITDFNNANTGRSAAVAGTALELDDTKLQAYLEDELGVDGTVAAGITSTSTLDDLATALSGVEGFTAPSSWTGDTTNTVAGLGVDGLAAAFSAGQEESPAVLATNRGLQDGDLVINGVTIAASSALDDKSSYTGAATSEIGRAHV